MYKGKGVYGRNSRKDRGNVIEDGNKPFRRNTETCAADRLFGLMYFCEPVLFNNTCHFETTQPGECPMYRYVLYITLGACVHTKLEKDMVKGLPKRQPAKEKAI